VKTTSNSLEESTPSQAFNASGELSACSTFPPGLGFEDEISVLSSPRNRIASAKLTLSLYDWNDKTWTKSYSNTILDGKETKEVFATHDWVRQIWLWRQDGEKCNPLDAKLMNQYSMIRDWTIVQADNGDWDIVKTNPAV